MATNFSIVINEKTALLKNHMMEIAISRAVPKNGDHGLVTGLGIRVVKPKIFPKFIIATDALAIDEGLGRGIHIVFVLEGIGFFPCGQMMILYLITLAFEQEFALKAKRT